MFFGRRRVERARKGLSQAARYYDQGREIVRRADGVVKRGISLYANNTALQKMVPAEHRAKVQRGMDAYNQLRQRAADADRTVQSIRGK